MFLSRPDTKPPVADPKLVHQRDEFLSLPQVSSNPLATRMIAIFDEDGGGDVDFQEFVSGLSAFSSKGNKEEKLRFAFKVYDIDRDGYISNGELFIVLKMMVGSNLKDQQLQQIVDKTIMEADLDRDGKISFEEFTRMVENTDVSMSMTLGESSCSTLSCAVGRGKMLTDLSRPVLAARRDTRMSTMEGRCFGADGSRLDRTALLCINALSNPPTARPSTTSPAARSVLAGNPPSFPNPAAPACGLRRARRLDPHLRSSRQSNRIAASASRSGR